MSALFPPGQVQGKLDRIKWSHEIVKEILTILVRLSNGFAHM